MFGRPRIYRYDAIKARIAEIVRSEPKHCPFTDYVLADLIDRGGLRASRNVVWQLRTELGLASFQVRRLEYQNRRRGRSAK
jgi:DNA-directed RNA polymerase specialized sigma54-like protein